MMDSRQQQEFIFHKFSDVMLISLLTGKKAFDAGLTAPI